MLERLRPKLAGLSYSSLALESVVVIIGILIAFHIDRWAEDRRDRDHEYDYLVRLKDDLQGEIQSMDVALRQAESRIAAVLLLEEAIENPSVARVRPHVVVAAVETATWDLFRKLAPTYILSYKAPAICRLFGRYLCDEISLTTTLLFGIMSALGLI